MADTTHYVRIALKEEEFAKLLELIKDSEEPVAYRLRAKLLTHQAQRLERITKARPRRTSPKKGNT